MTTVISLIAGPGAGKSTLAAELYAKMKRQGLDVEMVREVAKEWAYDGRKIGPFEQLSILGEQIKKESSLFNKVDYIVTDSPVFLGAFYLNYNHNQDIACEFVKNYYNFGKEQRVQFLNYVIPRRGDYRTEGRYESEEQAKFIDSAIKVYLRQWHYQFELFGAAEITNEEMIEEIMRFL